jgi:hypothetical protein
MRAAARAAGFVLGAAGLAACSLLVDAGGLTGAKPPGAGDAGADDAPTASDVGASDRAAEAAPDATAAQFLDDFNRADGIALGNGWAEKNPIAFELLGGEVVKPTTQKSYRDNLAYRPSAEDRLDVEASIEVRFRAMPPDFAQIFVRAQRAGIEAPDAYDGYLFYVDGDPSRVVLGRQRGGAFVVSLDTFSLTSPLDATRRFRMRLSARGTLPVELTATVEVLAGGTWQAIGSATHSDAEQERVQTPGATGFSMSEGSDTVYDNFKWVERR